MTANLIDEMKAVAQNPATRQYLLANDPKTLARLDRRIAKMERAEAALIDWNAPAAFRLPGAK